MKYELTAEVVKTVMEAPFIVVADIETTGFSGSYEDIIEIGAVLLDTQQHKIAVDKDGKALRFDRIVKPLRRKNIPQKIEALILKAICVLGIYFCLAMSIIVCAFCMDTPGLDSP